METCVTEVGSHTVTFWTYFMIRWVFQWTMSSAYALMDGTSVRMADQHNSDYRQRPTSFFLLLLLLLLLLLCLLLLKLTEIVSFFVLFSKVMFWSMCATTVSPFIAGAVIEDPEEGSGGKKAN